MSRLLAFSGAGLIGSNFLHYAANRTNHKVATLDELTPVGDRTSLARLPEDQVTLVAGDTHDADTINSFWQTRTEGVVPGPPQRTLDLDLSRIQSTGFEPRNQFAMLDVYLASM